MGKAKDKVKVSTSQVATLGKFLQWKLAAGPLPYLLQVFFLNG